MRATTRLDATALAAATEGLVSLREGELRLPTADDWSKLDHVKEGARAFRTRFSEEAETLAEALAEFLSPDSYNPERIQAALAAFEPLGVPLLVYLLGSCSERDACIATVGLSASGKDGAPAVPALIATFQRGSLRLKVKSAFALGCIGPDAAPAAPALVEGLYGNAYLEAANALGRIGAVAIPELSRAVRDADSTVVGPFGTAKKVREYALLALQNMGPRAARAVGLVIETLNDQDTEVLRRAIWTLQSIGPTAAPALPRLGELTRHEELGVRQTAKSAIAKIRPPRVLG